MNDIDAYLDQHGDAFEESLCELLRIPSVSADSAHRQDVRRAADYLADHLRGLDFEVDLTETDGHPIVYAEALEDDGRPTVLVYGHYDVQPPDPLDLWVTPPFEPTRRNGNLYARGATDDKGQMFTHIHGAEAWKKVRGRLPVNIKFLIEGEEETGSPNLEPYIAENRARLGCDVVVVSDTSQFGPGQPAITYGLRGIAYYELRLKGPAQDLHSGTFGGAVVNPANSLAGMLAALVDKNGRIQIPGFYDDVAELGAAEREQLAELPFDEREFLDQIGASAGGGEAGYTNLERRWVRPTYDVNGIWGGYQGEGAKTVLPSLAGAKFSFRLVPNQDPEKISTELRVMLEAMCPPGIEMELVGSHGAPGVVVPLESPYMAAASRAIEYGFGTAPVMIREGGSIPIVTTFHEELGVDTLLLGWGLNDDNTHAPNEKFNLADFHRGIKSSARLWHELAAL